MSFIQILTQYLTYIRCDLNSSSNFINQLIMRKFSIKFYSPLSPCMRCVSLQGSKSSKFMGKKLRGIKDLNSLW